MSPDEAKVIEVLVDYVIVGGTILASVAMLALSINNFLHRKKSDN